MLWNRCTCTAQSIAVSLNVKSALLSHLNKWLPVLVTSAFQSNIIGWASQNLSNRDLNVGTESTSVTWSGGSGLLQILTVSAVNEHFRTPYWVYTYFLKLQKTPYLCRICDNVTKLTSAAAAAAAAAVVCNSSAASAITPRVWNAKTQSSRLQTTGCSTQVHTVFKKTARLCWLNGITSRCTLAHKPRCAVIYM